MPERKQTLVFRLEDVRLFLLLLLFLFSVPTVWTENFGLRLQIPNGAHRHWNSREWEENPPEEGSRFERLIFCCLRKCITLPTVARRQPLSSRLSLRLWWCLYCVYTLAEGDCVAFAWWVVTGQQGRAFKNVFASVWLVGFWQLIESSRKAKDNFKREK